MKRFSTIFFYTMVALLLLWQLPWCYNFFVTKPYKAPFTLYSGIIGDFVMVEHQEKGMVRKDRMGNRYTQAAFDSIMPTLYIKQLVADGRFPDSLYGVPVTPKELYQDNLTFRTSPSDISRPEIGLYPLLESQSGRVELEMPDDLFRFTSEGMEFVEIKQNKVIEEKSRRFTESLQAHGFRFPAQAVSGNPSVKKEYDEGYLVIDDAAQLFHLKMIQGEPYVHRVTLPDGLQPSYVYQTEFKNRKILGFVIGEDHQFYVLKMAGYVLAKLPIRAYNPRTDYLIILGNRFDWTVRVVSDDQDEYYAVDGETFALIKQMTLPVEHERLWGIHFTSPKDKWIYPRLD